MKTTTFTDSETFTGARFIVLMKRLQPKTRSFPFDSLVKMVHEIARAQDRQPAFEEIVYAIRRNFGGHKQRSETLLTAFMSALEGAGIGGSVRVIVVANYEDIFLTPTTPRPKPFLPLPS
jgi:uncharacterized protein with von Willebrand factor type A (vWA) domain